MLIKSFQNAGIFLLAFFFVSQAHSQRFIERERNTCESESLYLELNKQNTFYLSNAMMPSLENVSQIKSFKVIAPDFNIVRTDKEHQEVDLIPLKTGSCTIRFVIKTASNEKITYEKTYQVVTLPELTITIASSAPGHDFIWLKLTDETGFDCTDEYGLCLIKYSLTDSTGELKTNGTICHDPDFFPSVSLKGIQQYFTVHDLLSLEFSTIHKKYGLVNPVKRCTIEIKTLWE
ncbi:MAG: hypothetical protein IPM74_07840 [Crocinitomicaceae bacterium]|nr:hypothetical protein [Crocinitomicaceae bacterium]MBK8925810.1 hypothetical protein [Crocinitomicaceae bacterium]